MATTKESRSVLLRTQEASSQAVALNRRRGDTGILEAMSGRRRGDIRDAATPLGRRGRPPVCTFAGFRLEADGTLRRGAAVVHLPPKELAALRLLLGHASQIVSPLQLKHALWGDVHVTTDSVPKCLSSLRARLEPESCIQTVYKRGYRFTAEVKWQGTPPSGSLPRLAILPFATQHFVPRHLGSAIAEEAITRLTNVRSPAISVLARDSVFTLVDRGLTAQQIGQALKADLVLIGNLSALPLQFRLRAEMIRVEDGTQIWVEDLLVDQNRIAGLETELVRRLAWRLGIWTAGADSLRPESNQGGISISAAAAAPAVQEISPERREAYDSFQRGHHEWQTLHRHRMQDGLQQLLRAIEVDPTLISAKIDLAHLCVIQAFYGYMSPGVAADYVHRSAESILDIPRQAETMLLALGWVHFHYDRNLTSALRVFSQSAHLPHSSWTTRIRAMFALSRGLYDDAIELLRAAIAVDPYAPWLQSRLAWAMHLDGQAAASLRQIKSTLSLFPEHEFTNLYGALILAYNGEAEYATQIAHDLGKRLPFFDLATAVHAYALACDGRKDQARSILERLQWLSRERFLLRSFTPAVHVALGDTDAAIEELQAANESRCPWFFQMLADPRLKPLRSNPDFQRMQSILASMEAEAEENGVWEG